jgi:TonB family protein
MGEMRLLINLGSFKPKNLIWFLLKSLVIHHIVFLGIKVGVTPTKEHYNVQLSLPPSPPKDKPKTIPRKGFLNRKLDLFPSKNNSHYSGKMGDSIPKSGGFTTAVTTNSLEDVKFKYASFFERIRAALQGPWSSKVRELIKEYYKKTGRPYQQQRVRVFIELDALGNLINCKVIGPSFSTQFDSIALNAFKEVSPFPNPPKDLIINGRVTFDWEFILYE